MSHPELDSPKSYVESSPNVARWFVPSHILSKLSSSQQVILEISYLDSVFDGGSLGEPGSIYHHAN